MFSMFSNNMKYQQIFHADGNLIIHQAYWFDSLDLRQ